MTMIIGIGAGGLAGVFLRWGIINAMPAAQPFLATVVSNCLGCFLAGVWISISDHMALSELLKMTLLVGLCGALTTFSTFILDFIRLLSQQLYQDAVTYFIGTQIAGVIVLGIGYVVGTYAIRWVMG